jgi:hypothetical protein
MLRSPPSVQDATTATLRACLRALCTMRIGSATSRASLRAIQAYSVSRVLSPGEPTLGYPLLVIANATRKVQASHGFIPVKITQDPLPGARFSAIVRIAVTGVDAEKRTRSCTGWSLAPPSSSLVPQKRWPRGAVTAASPGPRSGSMRQRGHLSCRDAFVKMTGRFPPAPKERDRYARLRKAI